MQRFDVAKSSWILTLAATAVVVAALYLAKSVLIPITLAVLLSFLLAPLCDRLERWRVGRVPSVIIAAVLAFALLGALGFMVSIQLTELADKLPSYRENIEKKLYSVRDYATGAFGRLSKTADEISQQVSSPANVDADSESEVRQRSYPVRVIAPPRSALQIAGAMFGTAFEILTTAGIVIIFVIFFLVRREDLRDRFIRLVGHGRWTVTTQAIGDAATRISRYLLTQLFINTAYGIAVGIGLLLIGVPNAVLWGLLGAVLRFVPYHGPWIAAAMPITLSVALSPDWKMPLLTVGMFVVLELITSNVMEPWLYGTRTGVSPVAVLVAAVFWTWLWGGVGLVLATPLTVCLVVVGKNVPQLSFLNLLLGDQPVFEPSMRVYQRLLAGDAEEAAELVEELRGEKPLVQLYDTVLIPALSLAERDRHRGELDEARRQFIAESLKTMVADLGERDVEELDELREAAARETAAPAMEDRPPLNGQAHDDSNKNGEAERVVPRSVQLRILCVPARDEADAIAATMLAQVLEGMGFSVETVSVAALAGEIVNLVEEHNADLVCISAMPPFAATHARYLYKRLRPRFPELNVVVGLWSTRGDLTKARDKLACDDSTQVASTLADAQEEIGRLIQPLLLRQNMRQETDELASQSIG